MNCYDCRQSGKTIPAVAVCHDCGAGVCPDHTSEDTHHLTVTRAIDRQIAVDPPERRIRCHTCAAAHGAAETRIRGEVHQPGKGNEQHRSLTKTSP